MSKLTSEFLAAYEGMTTGCGGRELSDWSIVALAGEDRAKFLHNMCTNDIVRLNPGEGCEAFFTDVKGKIIAHAFVLALEDCLHLLTVPGQAQRIITHLEHYIIREDVDLDDVTAGGRWTLVSGTKSSNVLKSNFQAVPASFLWPECYFVRASQCELEDLCSFHNDESAWETLRIESRFPLFGIDFNSTNLPQEVARDHLAISFKKGCYLGQETIARVDALGHVNQQLCSVKFAQNDVPRTGTRLLAEEQEVGVVTSACWSPRHSAPLGLTMLRRGSNEVGCVLESDFGKATVIAVV
jgi:folate-binding protein YgfZ